VGCDAGAQGSIAGCKCRRHGTFLRWLFGIALVAKGNVETHSAKRYPKILPRSVFRLRRLHTYVVGTGLPLIQNLFLGVGRVGVSVPDLVAERLLQITQTEAARLGRRPLCCAGATVAVEH
jgi:hypothetical protein